MWRICCFPTFCLRMSTGAWWALSFLFLRRIFIRSCSGDGRWGSSLKSLSKRKRVTRCSPNTVWWKERLNTTDGFSRMTRSVTWKDTRKTIISEAGHKSLVPDKSAFINSKHYKQTRAWWCKLPGGTELTELERLLFIVILRSQSPGRMKCWEVSLDESMMIFHDAVVLPKHARAWVYSIT